MRSLGRLNTSLCVCSKRHTHWMRVFVIHLTGTHQTNKQSEFIRWSHWWKIHASIFPSTIHFSQWNNNSMTEKATNQLAACSLMYVYICCSICNQLWSVQGRNKRRESRARAFQIPCQQAAWCWCSLFSEGLCRQMTGQESLRLLIRTREWGSSITHKKHAKVLVCYFGKDFSGFGSLKTMSPAQKVAEDLFCPYADQECINSCCCCCCDGSMYMLAKPRHITPCRRS